MKHLIAAALVCIATTAWGDPAGLRLTKLEMPHHDKRSGVSIWYPNGGGGDVTTFGGNAVFHGVDAAIWAEVPVGRHPVVLFSHGMGGTFRAQSWLGAGLAQRGAIVVSVNHAGSTWGDFDMARGVKHWTRAADLSVALDMLQDDPAFAGRVDPQRIMAAGFSYGGWTALSLGGLRGNHAGMVATCQEQGAQMAACETFLSESVNMQGLDPEVWNQSYADARVTHVAAIDPGLVWGLRAEDTQDLVAQSVLIGLGAGADRMSAADFDASGLSGLIQAHTLQLAPAFHFSAMPLCKPDGTAILKADNDDPVCTDPKGTDRAAVHARIIDVIAEMLDL